jgi:hypothetical protein
MRLLHSFLRWFTNLSVPRRILKLRDNSARWKRLRAAHLKKEPCCAVCGRSKNVEVHHVVPVAVDETRQLDPHNLITLCVTPCHFMFGHFFCYHCYNKNVRNMAAEFRKAMKEKICLERFQ